MKPTDIRLTQYSHGAGCGCKISPAVLDSILSVSDKSEHSYPHLLVGNEARDDAAVMDLGDGSGIISTTDFFMPIVDDPKLFGQIAATNAISDIYAMAGRPVMAIAILGWPVNTLAPEIAGQVIRGAQITCDLAGIPLAGGHSIDSPEPIFGLAVTGRVLIENLKKNNGAIDGDILFITKPLGIGILSTAQKQGKLLSEHSHLSAEVMIRLNSIGEQLGKISGVHAMTDVTGFGLAGHLIEMSQGSKVTAEIDFKHVPLIHPSVLSYIDKGCMPGGTNRNFDSYGASVKMTSEAYIPVLCDPQTSGGLLVAVSPQDADQVSSLLKREGLWHKPIGQMIKKNAYPLIVH